MNILSGILTALSYAPYVSAAVQQVEATSASLPGATKKAIVLASIQAAAKVGEAVPEAHVQLVSALIDVLVGVFNASGLFQQTKTAPAPALTISATVSGTTVK